MSQKKPTTNQQLEEMREMISNLEPGKVVTLDRELQQRNTTLMLMLYGATAKYGIGMAGDNGVLVTAQVPVLQVPANQSLQWEVSEDGKTVMMYIVVNETAAEDDTDKVETSPAGEGGSTDSSSAVSVSPPDLPPSAEEPFPGSTSIGDEFEDAIRVGMNDDESDELDDGH